MKKILIYITVVIFSNAMVGQTVKKQNLTESEVKEILLEYKSVQPKSHKLSEEFKFIDEINITEFLKSSFDKELALIAKQEDVKKIIKLTEKIILNIKDNQNLFFIPENNLFLNLYKKTSNEIEEKATTKILRNYLSKCLDIYYVDWLYGINLLSKYDTKSNVSNLVKLKFDTIESDQLFEVIYFLIPFADATQINKWLARINNDISNPSHKISLIYQMIKNCELTNSQKEEILLTIKNINSSAIYFDSHVAIETIKKDLNEDYDISKEYFYSFSNEEIIQYLRNDLNKEIPNYVEHLVDVKFVGNYFRRNEAILSWTLKYSDIASSYYSHPEQITLLDNKFYYEVFQFVFSNLESQAYSYLIHQSNGDEIELKTLIDKNLYSKYLVFNGTEPVGKQIEEYINDVLDSEKSRVVLNKVNFDYPMFIVETKDNFQKLKTQFKLRE